MSTSDPLADLPFSWHATKDGRLHISCNGKPAKTLKDPASQKLIRKLEAATEQEAQRLMAKETGQFKFGNERSGKLSLKS